MKLASPFFFLLFPLSLMAQVKNFVLPGFQWHEPTAWSPMGVPTANDSVIIDAETLIMPDSIGLAKHVLIGPAGSLEIQRDVSNNVPGVLIINNSPGSSFKNEGDLDVGGRLTIRNSRFTALVNYGTMNVQERAKIIIDSTTNSYGIYNSGTITSNGLIKITKPRIDGIRNISMITLQDSSELIIEGYDNNTVGPDGINNSMSLSSLTNHGRVSINSFDGSGIINRGTFENDGDIFLKFNKDTSLINTGDFKNLVSGLIQIDSASTGPGLFNTSLVVNAGKWMISNNDKEAIINLDSLINETDGMIEIAGINALGFLNMDGSAFLNSGTIDLRNISTDDAMENNGVIENDGLIYTNEIYEDGIQNNNYLINEPGGRIHTVNTGSYGFYSGPGALNENHGKISIDSANYGIYIRGQFHNHDSITFNIMEDWSVETLDTLYNHSGGVIRVLDAGGNTAFYNIGLCENYGIMQAEVNVNDGVLNSGQFLNDGEILLTNMINDGIKNTTLGLFTNQGKILIDSTGDEGIDNQGSLINFDSIYLIRTIGTALLNKDTVLNQSGGYIQITDVNNLNYIGIQNGSGTLFTEFFSNDGHIKIDGSKLYGLWNQAIFIIANTGNLEILNTTETPLQNELLGLLDCFGTLTVQD